MIFMLIFALACEMGMAGMYSLMRVFRRELNFYCMCKVKHGLEFMTSKASCCSRFRSSEEKSCSCAEDTRTLWTHCIMGWRFVNNWGLWRMRTR